MVIGTRRLTLQFELIISRLLTLDLHRSTMAANLQPAPSNTNTQESLLRAHEQVTHLKRELAVQSCLLKRTQDGLISVKEQLSKLIVNPDEDISPVSVA